MPDISVIIPVFNAKPYLEECLASLLAQSFSDFEILLIDDGSTDGSGAVCDDFAAHHRFIKAYHKPNGGAASARNLGIESASGKYISFVDADDTVSPDFLKRLFDAAEENNADIVMCDYVKHTQNAVFPFSQPIRGGLYTKKQIEKELFPCLIMFDNLEFPPTISNWVCLFRRTLINFHGIRYPIVKLCEDSYFGSVCLYNADCFVYLKGCSLYNYLYHESSVSHSVDLGKAAARWASFVKLNRLYREYFESVPFDFGQQLNRNMLYFTLNQLSYIASEKDKSRAVAAIKSIMNDENVIGAFKGFKYPAVSLKLKVMIFLIRRKMALTYYFLHR